MVVLLGTPTEDASRLYAMTVTSGDPSWAGALAGVALGLLFIGIHNAWDTVIHLVTGAEQSDRSGEGS